MFSNLTGNATNSSSEILNFLPWKWVVTTERGLVLASFSFLLLVAIIGNGLVIVVATKVASRRIRTNNGFLVLHLCVANLFLSMLTLPFVIQNWAQGLNSWTLANGLASSLLCKLLRFLQEEIITVSSLTIVALSFDWFLLVLFPIRKKLHGYMFRLSLVLTWLVSVAYASPLLYITYVRDVKLLRKRFCYIGLDDHMGFMKIWVTAKIVICGLLPLLLIVPFNLTVIAKLWLKKRLENQIRRSRRRDGVTWKAFKILLSIVLVYYTCFFLHWLITLDTLYFQSPYTNSNKLRLAASFLAYSNSPVTSVLLLVLNEKYRSALFQLFRCNKRRVFAATEVELVVRKCNL